jgi:Pyruvate kinase, barrel domain
MTAAMRAPRMLSNVIRSSHRFAPGIEAFHQFSTQAEYKPAISIPKSSSALKTTFDLPDPSSSLNSNVARPLVKIVATIGPTSEQAEALKNVVHAGMAIMRLNFSHATSSEVVSTFQLGNCLLLLNHVHQAHFGLLCVALFSGATNP